MPCLPRTGLLRGDDPHRLAVEEAADVLDDVRVIALVVLLADVAEMRRQHARCRACGTDDRCGSGSTSNTSRPAPAICLFFSASSSALLLNDRPARGVDQVGRRLHQGELAGADQAAGALAECTSGSTGSPTCLNRSSLSTYSTPIALQRSGVRFWLQAMHLHAERLADAGRARAELAEAEQPSVLPSMSMPSVVCQCSPAFMRAFSQPIRRVSSRIRPKAMLGGRVAVRSWCRRP